MAKDTLQKTAVGAASAMLLSTAVVGAGPLIAPLLFLSAVAGGCVGFAAATEQDKED